MENPMTNLTTRERFGVATLLGVLSLLALGGWTYRASIATPPAASLAQAGVSAGSVTIAAGTPAPTPAPTAAPPKEIVVYVTGAVKRPGVYSFKSGQRLYHAVRKAGGFKAGAVEDALNLADMLKDADQIHVPKHAPEPTPAVEETCAALKREPETTPRMARAASLPAPAPRGRVLGKASAPVAAPAKQEQEPARPGKLSSASEGVVNLNKASSEELQRLPGIGPAMAERILQYRKEAGGFHELEELQEVRGIGEKTFMKLKELVTI